MALACAPGARSQQTLGGITGTVTDTSAACWRTPSVTLVGDQTTLTRTQKTNSSGSYEFVNLPIGTYTLTFSHDGFETQKIPSILVQADRTVSLNPALKVGQVGTTITVEETPLLNAVDTTNGYVLDKAELEAIPLPTGSFTGLAILSPGVSAELPAGTGANAGLGNQPIWANGQRDTSNTFLLNGVDAKNLFNGKSTSQVASARIVNNTGVSGAASGNGGVIQSTASPYLAVGQSLPTPAPETIQEVRVNTSMYDAQQGSTSGAHIDMSTASGTNAIHGTAYLHRGTDWLNAAPFFFNQDPNHSRQPESSGTASLHFGRSRWRADHQEQTFRLSRLPARAQFRSGDRHRAIDRSGQLHCSELRRRRRAEHGNAWRLAWPTFPTPISALRLDGTVGTGPNQINPIALGIFQYKLPNGQYLVPWNDGNTPSLNFPENALSPGTAYFLSDQAVSNLDWIVNSKDTLALKYYYQHDPSIAPYAYSSVPGFTQHLDAGSQVASITNTQIITPNLNVAEVFGFIREKVYSTIGQPFTPAQFASFVESSTGASPAESTINTFGSNFFPGMTIVNMLGTNSLTNPNNVNAATLTIGQGAQSQGANTGIFQNRFMPSANATWNHGKHTVSFGGTYSYTQLNTRDQRPGTGMIGTADLSQFLQGFVTPYTSDGYPPRTSCRAMRTVTCAPMNGALYVQDKFQFRPNLSFTVGLRFDDDGGLSEKYGRLYNFDPSQYDYDPSTDTLISNGIIVAGNNPQFATQRCQPFHFDRPPVGSCATPGSGLESRQGLTTSSSCARAGVCTTIAANSSPIFPQALRPASSPADHLASTRPRPSLARRNAPHRLTIMNYIPTCDPTPTGLPIHGARRWDLLRRVTRLRLTTTCRIPEYRESESALAFSKGKPLFPFGVYNRKNKLPYTMNQTLDIQWQPRQRLGD